MQLLEVLDGGLRRELEVAAVVLPVVMLQREAPSGRWDELPGPGGFGPRIGSRDAFALDEQDELQIVRQSGFGQLALGDRKAAAGALRQDDTFPFVFQEAVELELDPLPHLPDVERHRGAGEGDGVRKAVGAEE